MPREIFGEVSNPSVKLGSQAWYTVPLSIFVHAALLAVAIVVPLIATGTMPQVPTVLAFAVPPKLPDVPPPPPAPVPRAVATQSQASPDAAPREAPDTIPPEVERPPLPGPPGVIGGINVGTGSGVHVGTGVNIGPPPPVPQPPAPPAFVRPGGDIKIPRKVHHVAPTYPAIAQQAKVEGTVTIEATIGVDGRVKDARVIGSRPLLDEAAINAVLQWRFTPTLLNGVPVPVLMTVRVTFTLR
jgi:periplasmic protein TonB